MTTLATALAAVRTRVNEATAIAWSSTEIRGWINEAVADIARRTETIQKEATVTVVSGTQEYSSLPANLLRLHRVEFISSNNHVSQLELRELNELDSIWYGGKKTSPGRPMYCGLSGYPPYLKLTLYPIPAETGATLKLYYYASPTALATDGTADSSTLDIPTGWDDLVYEYATYLAQRRDGQAQWQDSKRLYEEKLSDMLSQTVRFHDQSGYMVMEETYGADMYGGYGGW